MRHLECANFGFLIERLDFTCSCSIWFKLKMLALHLHPQSIGREWFKKSSHDMLETLHILQRSEGTICPTLVIAYKPLTTKCAGSKPRWKEDAQRDHSSH